MTENQISYEIRGAIYDVHNKLGPGFLESIYCKALRIELERRDLKVMSEVAFDMQYDGIPLGLGFRLDLLVEDKVIVELKFVEELHKVHHKQLISYLKVTGKRLGILVNFNVDEIDEGIFRKVNNLK